MLFNSVPIIVALAPAQPPSDQREYHPDKHKCKHKQQHALACASDHGPPAQTHEYTHTPNTDTDTHIQIHKHTHTHALIHQTQVHTRSTENTTIPPMQIHPFIAISDFHCHIAHDKNLEADKVSRNRPRTHTNTNTNTHVHAHAPTATDTST